ncbi:MAG TPA: NADP-dependent oxidoreductase [Steroidobacteraceae bacterium]|nr:NADP-dependent oxidoreductase [Steroidobacteraceae bacterium]
MKFPWLLASALVLGLATGLSSGAVTHPVPQSMNAAGFDKAGGPEVLSLHRVPVPIPKADEVLIAVYAAGVSVWEDDMRAHLAVRSPPFIMGGEGSGTIVAVGSDVHNFKPGDEVYGMAGIGFYAEYVKVGADRIARVPQSLDLTQASILGISGLSALQGIDDVLELRAGQSLIIHGASGAVGTLAIQIAKHRGVRVLATATTAEGLALVKQLGADVVVNGRTGDIAAAAKAFAPDGVDAVLGLAGGESLEHCIDALRHGSGRVAYLYGLEPLPRPRGTIRMTLYNFVGGSSQLQRLNQEVAAAKLRVPVAATYALAQAADAHRRLEAGHLLGKIVLLAHGSNP